MNVNKLFLAGHISQGPEIRATTTGKSVCQFSVAVNRTWKTESGETKEEVNFFNCQAFGRTAEAIGQHLIKGSPIFVEGRLKLESWLDKNTKEKRHQVKVIVESFQFVGKKQGGQEAIPDPAGKPLEVDDSDVPF